jgi:hypothetical protein
LSQDDVPTANSVDALARRHGLSVAAVQALADALAAGGGASAQWNNPDLGGMGQWSGGGMLQIGAMFDHDLKARVAATLEDLAHAGRVTGSPGARAPGVWWPDGLGEPAASGAQNAMRYACFPDQRRLAVERDGMITVYDTGRHRLTGFAQAQGGGRTLLFSGSDGTVTLDDLAVVAT